MRAACGLRARGNANSFRRGAKYSISRTANAGRWPPRATEDPAAGPCSLVAEAVGRLGAGAALPGGSQCAAVPILPALVSRLSKCGRSQVADAAAALRAHAAARRGRFLFSGFEDLPL